MSTTFSVTPIPRGTLRQDLMNRLVAGIVQGYFVGGDRLVVQKLANQFNISPTPVREALVELVGMGLATMTPNCGATVNPFHAKQLREIYHMRRLLETEATRCACGNINVDELRKTKNEMEQLQSSVEVQTWPARVVFLDEYFHDLIATSCGNGRLANEIKRYNHSLMKVIREVVGNQLHAQEVANADHLRIIEALLAGDSARAAAAMSDHLSGTADVVEAIMFPASRQAAPAG